MWAFNFPVGPLSLHSWLSCWPFYLLTSCKRTMVVMTCTNIIFLDKCQRDFSWSVVHVLGVAQVVILPVQTHRHTHTHTHTPEGHQYRHTHTHTPEGHQYRHTWSVVHVLGVAQVVILPLLFDRTGKRLIISLDRLNSYGVAIWAGLLVSKGVNRRSELI